MSTPRSLLTANFAEGSQRARGRRACQVGYQGTPGRSPEMLTAT
jgi:hypothetical protein